MSPIKRIGPPTPLAVRGTEYELSVPLNAAPSRDWRRAFHAPTEWTEPRHPSRITVKDRTLTFTSVHPQVTLWIRLIDEWIDAANRSCADLQVSATRRQATRDEQERDELSRLREATETLKTL
jgi:hypothetical protein